MYRHSRAPPNVPPIDRGRLIGVLRLAVFCLACHGLGGCIPVVTHGIGAVERAVAVGEAYPAWQTHMPPVPAGKGRIIAFPGESLSLVYETTGFGKGGDLDFVVDRDVCTVLGRSFVFLDYPAGPHELSVDDVSDLLDPFTYKKGRHKIDLTIAAGSVTYIRFDKQRGDMLVPHYFAKKVDAAAAAPVLKDYVIDKDGLACKPHRAEDRKP